MRGVFLVLFQASNNRRETEHLVLCCCPHFAINCDQSSTSILTLYNVHTRIYIIVDTNICVYKYISKIYLYVSIFNFLNFYFKYTFKCFYLSEGKIYEESDNFLILFCKNTKNRAEFLNRRAQKFLEKRWQLQQRNSTRSCGNGFDDRQHFLLYSLSQKGETKPGESQDSSTASKPNQYRNQLSVFLLSYSLCLPPNPSTQVYVCFSPQPYQTGAAPFQRTVYLGFIFSALTLNQHYLSCATAAKWQLVSSLQG